jgi:hypothetical protein
MAKLREDGSQPYDHVVAM